MRRRWLAEAKARITASSFEPGANIAEIARTHELLPPQLYVCRHDSVLGRCLTSKKLSAVPAVIEGAKPSTDNRYDDACVNGAVIAPGTERTK